MSSRTHLALPTPLFSDLLVIREEVLMTGETLPLLVSEAEDKCIDFICCTASSRSLVSSADFWEVNLGGLGRLIRGEDEPLSLSGSVGEDAEELEGDKGGGKFNRGIESSKDMSGFAFSRGKTILLGGGVGLPASLVGWDT